MAVTTYAGWVANGKPAYEAQPILDMVDMFKSHGYTVYWYPDQRHLTANPPEDHTPFSHTPWPGVQPYPLVLALDLMPLGAAGGASLAPIARRIIADRDAGTAPWIKYINWTDEQGKVWHTKWQPTKVTTSSTDSGHIHLSVRTDYADPAQAAAAGHSIYAAQGWDPITMEDEMTPEQASQLANIYAAIFTGGGSMGPAVPPEYRIPSDGSFGNSIGSRLLYIQHLAETAPPGGDGGATVEQITALFNATKLVTG